MTETTYVLNEAFEPEKEEGTPDRAPLPKGFYTACIIDASVGMLKSGKGQAVNLTWEIEFGEYQGRLVFDRCIISHESSEAMKYGRMKFKDICSACGIVEPVTDLSVIRNKSCKIWIAVEEDKGGEYPPKNKVGRIRPVNQEPLKANGKADFNDSIPY